ncbi:hypothetical protein Tco_0360948 [Tanacetum coccineum]
MNLANLFLRRVTVHAKVFDIITPRVTKLTLIDCEHSGVVSVIAPELENLTVNDSSINYMKAPLRLSKDEPYKEKAARETINMLQELHSARCLTLKMDIVEFNISITLDC